MRYLKNRRGLTLIELLIVIAILGIIMAAVSAFIFPTMTFFAKTQNTVSAKDAANLIMDTIEGSVYSTDKLTLEAATANPPASITDAAVYLITADENKGITTYKGKEPARTDALSAGIYSGLQFDIAFSSDSAKVLKIVIKVQNKQNAELLYALEKDIYLSNLLASGDKINNDGSASPYREIQFTKPNGTIPTP